MASTTSQKLTDTTTSFFSTTTSVPPVSTSTAITDGIECDVPVRCTECIDTVPQPCNITVWAFLFLFEVGLFNWISHFKILKVVRFQAIVVMTTLNVVLIYLILFQLRIYQLSCNIYNWIILDNKKLLNNTYEILFI